MKITTTVSIDGIVKQEAIERGINISQTCENALRELLEMPKEQLIDENLIKARISALQTQLAENKKEKNEKYTITEIEIDENY